MKNLTVLAALLLPLSLLSKPPAQNAVFLEASLQDARRQAAEEGKLLFIHFAAGWCMPCQWMEQAAFTEPVLAAFLEDTYLGLRADVDAPEWRAMQQQYGIKKLPTILAFNTRGQLLGRHEGAMEAEALYEQLQAHDLPANRALCLIEGEETTLLSSPKPILRLSRPALLPDAPPARQAVLPFHTTAPPPASPVHYANRQQPAFFSVQAGLFSSYENAVRESTKLEMKTGETARLAPDSTTGQVVYRVYFGRFAQREEARNFLQKLEQRGVSGFIKELQE